MSARPGLGTLALGAGLVAVVVGAGFDLGVGPFAVAPPEPRRVRPVTARPERATALAAPRAYGVVLEGVDEAPPARRRSVAVDLQPIVGEPRRVDVTYDTDAVTRPTTLDALRTEPDWVAGVRLLLGEVGVGRLRASRWSLVEGVGILETVRNRFDPDLANPLRIPRVADWPGCGIGGTFATCIDPGEYLGVVTVQALRPREAAPDARVLLEATDRAVAAWFVFEESLLGDVTAGATSFVHLCGGAAYGRSHRTCTGPGAEPLTGPAVFRGPSAWLPEQGRYALSVLAKVDYARGDPPRDARAYVTYLLSSDAAVYADVGAEPARR